MLTSLLPLVGLGWWLESVGRGLLRSHIAELSVRFARLAGGSAILSVNDGGSWIERGAELQVSTLLLYAAGGRTAELLTEMSWRSHLWNKAMSLINMLQEKQTAQVAPHRYRFSVTLSIGTFATVTFSGT